MNLSIGHRLNLNSTKDFSLKDYYPFGMLMPGRNFSSTAYAYGYQGSLKDDEIKGSGNYYTTFFRENDPRIVQWLTSDPDFKRTPWESPYVSMGNNPIWHNDVLGNSTNDWVKRKDGKARYDPNVKKPDDVKKDEEYIGPSVWLHNPGTKDYYHYTQDKQDAIYSELPEVTVTASRPKALDSWQWKVIQGVRSPDFFTSNPLDKADYSPYNPDAIGVQVSYNFVPGSGFSQSFGVGIFGTDPRTFGNTSANIGGDVSFGISFFLADYRGAGKPSFESFKGAGITYNVGVEALSLSSFSDISKNRKGETVTGQNWVGFGVGASMGSAVPFVFSGSSGVGITYPLFEK